MIVANRYKCIDSLNEMYKCATNEMKINIGFILGRIEEDKERQTQLLREYAENVDNEKEFPLYKTLAISLICLQDRDMEKKYIELLTRKPEYAQEHLKLHCRYYYDNCEYIGSKGSIEYTKSEILHMVIQNTKNNILNCVHNRNIQGKERQERKNSLLIDIVTFYTALMSSVGVDAERDLILDARSVDEAISNIGSVPEELKQYAKYITFAYGMQQKEIVFP